MGEMDIVLLLLPVFGKRRYLESGLAAPNDSVYYICQLLHDDWALLRS